MEESYERRISTLRQLHESEHKYSGESMPKEIEDAFCFHDPGKFNIFGVEDWTVDSDLYIWHQYYQTKWDAFDFGSKGVAIAQTTNESKDLKESATVTAKGSPATSQQVDDADKMLSEIDMGVNVIRSNRVKMGLQTNSNHQQETRTLRESSLMSLAFGWTQSVEIPVGRIEQSENEQIVEAILTKSAQKHHLDNYVRLLRILGDNETSPSPGLSKYFLTVDPTGGDGHPVTQPDGILEGVTGKDLATLKPGAYG